MANWQCFQISAKAWFTTKIITCSNWFFLLLTLIAIHWHTLLPTDTILWTGTCHHFQTRGRQCHFLQSAYASLEWQLRRSHYGLFLRTGFLFSFHSTTFGSVIHILWCCIVKSWLELWESILGCRCHALVCFVSFLQYSICNWHRFITGLDAGNCCT